MSKPRTSVAPNPGNTVYPWTARCVCGWESKTTPGGFPISHREDAERAAMSHLLSH